jgi:HPt (histidine-containing phosphotransfer) domain-containing protein
MPPVKKTTDSESTLEDKPTDGNADEVNIEQVLSDIITPLINQLTVKTQSELKRVQSELTQAMDAKFAETKAPKTSDDEAPDSSNPAVKALMAKIEALENENRQNKAKQDKAELDAALKDAVASGSPEDYNLALAGLQHFAGSLTKVDGKFISENGKDLTTIAKEFYESPSGKRVLPSGILQGVTPPPSNTSRPNTVDISTLDERLMRGVGAI